jgi:hypothetical protein
MDEGSVTVLRNLIVGGPFDSLSGGLRCTLVD